VSRVSVELLPDAPAAEVLAAIRVADDSAIDTVFCVDEIYRRDACGLMAAAARETRRVRLAPGVAHVTLRDPLLVAQQLATLDELSKGRATATFSVGNLAMLAQFGYDPADLHPVRRLREAHGAMRSLLSHAEDQPSELLVPILRRTRDGAGDPARKRGCEWLDDSPRIEEAAPRVLIGGDELGSDGEVCPCRRTRLDADVPARLEMAWLVERREAVGPQTVVGRMPVEPPDDADALSGSALRQ
jgi:alkanesulfonate monooxygenase SsuD/methylene tetrahydromethanopterin reductase-like flavin-dependent oxidoreductase (luciferase family)